MLITKARDAQGFVLVAVIWMAGLLAVMATAFALTARSHSLVVRNVVWNSKAEYVADAVVRLKVFDLATLGIGNGAKLNGETTFCQWAPDVVAGFRIQDQAGLVDLNLASPELLAAVFGALSVSSEGVRPLMNMMQDYRDPDTQGTDGGTEPSNYPTKKHGPKNAPFIMAEELGQLPLFDDALLNKALPLFTVYSQQPGFDPKFAPEQLLKLLAASGASLDHFTAASPSKIFAIDALVKSKQGATFYRQAIIALILQPDRPFAILEWKHGQDAGDWVFPAVAQSSCFN